MDLGVTTTDRSSNPLFNANKLKLGSFAANISYGGAMTTAAGTFQPTWPNVMEIADIVDSSGMEAMIPVARWRGFGGKTEYNGSSYESFAWAAGIGGSTKRMSPVATCHVQTMHPIVAAKQSTTIDHITNGRFTLNLVCGWFTNELEMFGAPMKEHDTRYDYAEEWITVAKLLWAGEDNFDFNGKFLTVKKGWHRPKPIQSPFPVLINAGASKRGLDFAAKHCDVLFTVVGSFEEGRIEVDRLRKYAREKYGREILVWTNCYCVVGDTDAEAEAYLKYYVEEKGDWEAVQNYISILGVNSETVPPHLIEHMKYHYVAGYGGFPMVGRADTIAERLKGLSDIGIDGVAFTFARYKQDLTRLAQEVIPLLVKYGIRQA
ncbi:MAG: LLM class flavin-dependent oxidoreductase [Pseudorhodoplanes sp.]